ncbi:MAG: DUF5667 domain-containing protein, partial [Methanosarcinales archaeon]
MDDEFKVSKNLLKTITVDTRVDILKSLEDRPMTASELSRFLNKHVTTVAEHLNLIKNSNLIERVERPGRKWIYYKLTREGKKVLHPESYRWVMVIAVTFFVFVSGLFIWNVDAYPGQFLYGIKRARENLQLALIPSNIGRAKKHVELAEERLKEAKAVSELGKKELVKEAVRSYRNEISNARSEIEKAKKKKINIISGLEVLSEATPKYVIILEHLMVRTPEIKEDIQPALGASIESHQSTV